jgi:hypothetical protein
MRGKPEAGTQVRYDGQQKPTELLFPDMASVAVTATQHRTVNYICLLVLFHGDDTPCEAPSDEFGFVPPGYEDGLNFTEQMASANQMCF